MKYFPLLALLLLTLVSCRVYNPIRQFSDREGARELRLDQNLRVKVANPGPNAGNPESVFASFKYVQHAAARPEIMADFRFKGDLMPDQPDSVLYFILDGEKIRLTAGKTEIPNKPGASRRLGGSLNFRVLVPENLWVSVAHAGTVKFLFGRGVSAVEVLSYPAGTAKLRQFFQQACSLRDIAFPEIPQSPPGLKKW